MMEWFGPAPFAPVCDDTPSIPTPVGVACSWCEEPIAPLDRGFYVPGNAAPTHHECFMRQVVGSVAHQRRQCTCFGGHEDDEDGRSRRDAAVAAYAEWAVAQRLA